MPAHVPQKLWVGQQRTSSRLFADDVVGRGDVGNGRFVQPQIVNEAVELRRHRNFVWSRVEKTQVIGAHPDESHELTFSTSEQLGWWWWGVLSQLSAHIGFQIVHGR